MRQSFESARIFRIGRIAMWYVPSSLLFGAAWGPLGGWMVCAGPIVFCPMPSETLWPHVGHPAPSTGETE